MYFVYNKRLDDWYFFFFIQKGWEFDLLALIGLLKNFSVGYYVIENLEQYNLNFLQQQRNFERTLDLLRNLKRVEVSIVGNDFCMIAGAHCTLRFLMLYLKPTER